eukprot:scaffold584_cov343-Prasinococcus_capsulatus_cf.AAC.9
MTLGAPATRRRSGAEEAAGTERRRCARRSHATATRGLSGASARPPCRTRPLGSGVYRTAGRRSPRTRTRRAAD